MLISGTTGQKEQVLPGIVLSKMKATEPPTNMAVVRRTFNTWSISAIPEKILRDKQRLLASNQVHEASTFKRL